MEYRDMLNRYVGRRVCVSTFGHAKLWGKLAAVSEDCVRLVNTTLSSEGEDQWLAQSQYNDPDSDFGVRHPETIVHFHHIVAITCLDDDLPEPSEFAASGDAAVPLLGMSGAGQRRSDGTEKVGLDDVFEHLRLERLEVLIGSNLIPLANPKTIGSLTERMVNLRNLVGAQLGFVLPAARLRDDPLLDADEYRILVNGAEVGRGVIRTRRQLAIHAGCAKTILEGERTFEPLKGQPAIWIEPSLRAAAEGAGYIVVEPAAVLAMHLQNEVKRHAHELFSIEGLRMLLDHLRQTTPVVVEELIPNRISLSRLHDLLARLLEEEVPLRPLERILERIAHLAMNHDDVEQLLAELRTSIGRILCDRFRDESGQLALFTLDRELSDRLDRVLLGEPEPTSGIWLARFVDGLRNWRLDHCAAYVDVLLVIDTDIRRRLWQMVSHQIPGLSVLAFSEVPHDLPVQLSTLSAADLGLAQAASRTPRRRAIKTAQSALPEPPRDPPVAKRRAPR